MSAGFRFIECEQGTPEWLAARAGLCTASRFSDAISTVNGLNAQQQAYVDAILHSGMSEAAAWAHAGYKAAPKAAGIALALQGKDPAEPSDVALRYAADMAIERISGKPFGEPPKTWLLNRGHDLERAARMAYEERHASFVTEAGLCMLDDAPFAYSTDGLVDDDGLIEIKAPIDGTKIRAMWRDGDVSEYVDQMQGGMWITGRKWCDFIMYCPDLANAKKDLYVKRIYRDDDYIDGLVLKLAKFQKLVDDAYADFTGALAVAPAVAPPAPGTTPRAGSRLAAILTPEQA